MRYSSFLFPVHVFLLLLCLLPSGCSNPAGLPGEVASVNGQSIFFNDLEERRGELFAARSPYTPPPADPVLLEQYRYVLRHLVEEALVLQYMEKKSAGPTPEALEEEESRIRGDYPDGEFDNVLVEQGISLEQWRERLRIRLAIQLFSAEVLRPDVVITTEEVEQYYREHVEDFMLPEQRHFLQISGKNSKQVAEAGKRLSAGEDPVAVQKEFLVVIHNVRTGTDVLPEDIRKILDEMSPMQLSKAVKDEEGEYRSFLLLEKTPAASLGAADIFARVETALLEEKIPGVYSQWLARRLEKADIRISPFLVYECVGGDGEEAGVLFPGPAQANGTLPAAPEEFPAEPD